MALIQKKKDGNYYVVYKLDGRQVWKTTGTAVYATAKTAEDTLLGKAAESRLHNKLSSLSKNQSYLLFC